MRIKEAHNKEGFKKYGKKVWEDSHPLYTWKNKENKLTTKISDDSDDVVYFVTELKDDKIKHYRETN